MTVKDDDGAPQSPIADKEPWETPRVVAAAIKEATAYYGSDDHTHS
ncbi:MULTISPECIES: hypothetical protein [unclassified Sphingomonas]|nr:MULTISPECIES: hypothetical protein [unclassified Sphingomonas]